MFIIIILNIGIDEKPSFFGKNRRRPDLNMVAVFTPQLREGMVRETFVPIAPVFWIKKIFHLLRVRERDRRPRMFSSPVGVSGEQHHDIAVDTLGEKCSGFCIKGSDDMPLGEVIGSIADGKGDLDVIWAEWVAAERGVKAVPAALEKGHARILAPEHVPCFLRGNDLLPRMEVRTVIGKCRSNT